MATIEYQGVLLDLMMYEETRGFAMYDPETNHGHIHSFSDLKQLVTVCKHDREKIRAYMLAPTSSEEIIPEINDYIDKNTRDYLAFTAQNYVKGVEQTLSKSLEYIKSSTPNEERLHGLLTMIENLCKVYLEAFKPEICHHLDHFLTTSEGERLKDVVIEYCKENPDGERYDALYEAIYDEECVSHDITVDELQDLFHRTSILLNLPLIKTSFFDDYIYIFIKAYRQLIEIGQATRDELFQLKCLYELQKELDIIKPSGLDVYFESPNLKWLQKVLRSEVPKKKGKSLALLLTALDKMGHKRNKETPIKELFKELKAIYFAEGSYDGLYKYFENNSFTSEISEEVARLKRLYP